MQRLYASFSFADVTCVAKATKQKMRTSLPQLAPLVFVPKVTTVHPQHCQQCRASQLTPNQESDNDENYNDDEEEEEDDADDDDDGNGDGDSDLDMVMVVVSILVAMVILLMMLVMVMLMRTMTMMRMTVMMTHPSCVGTGVGGFGGAWSL